MPYQEKMIPLEMFCDVYVGMEEKYVCAFSAMSISDKPHGSKRFKFTLHLPESAFTGFIAHELQLAIAVEDKQ